MHIPAQHRPAPQAAPLEGLGKLPPALGLYLALAAGAVLVFLAARHLLQRRAS